MRKTLSVLLAVALLGVLAATALAADRRINVGDDYFVKKGAKPTVTVKKGTRLVFRWVGDVTHNVRVTKGPERFGSKFMSKGTYRKVVRKRGTYSLVCDVHPKDMKLTLKVN